MGLVLIVYKLNKDIKCLSGRNCNAPNPTSMGLVLNGLRLDEDIEHLGSLEVNLTLVA